MVFVLTVTSLVLLPVGIFDMLVPLSPVGVNPLMLKVEILIYESVSIDVFSVQVVVDTFPAGVTDTVVIAGPWPVCRVETAVTEFWVGI